MISALTGQLNTVDEDRVHVEAGPLLYELLVPAADRPELIAARGQTITLHTIYYLAGDPARGGLEPTLIGFIRSADKQFFEHFTTVKGIGPRKALRALARPAGEVARAIEEKDTRFLSSLDGIGQRTAEQIIATLAGKVTQFATGYGKIEEPGAKPAQRRRPANETDAIDALAALGERRADAENLLDRAKAAYPDARTTDALLREMLRQRTVRA